MSPAVRAGLLATGAVVLSVLAIHHLGAAPPDARDPAFYRGLGGTVEVPGGTLDLPRLLDRPRLALDAEATAELVGRPLAVIVAELGEPDAVFGEYSGRCTLVWHSATAVPVVAASDHPVAHLRLDAERGTVRGVHLHGSLGAPPGTSIDPWNEGPDRP